MVFKKLRTDPFFHSIFLKQLYNHFVKLGKFYKLFLYYFFLNKLLKKKKIKIFSLIRYIIINYYFSIETRSKALSKKKKTAKKFKRKRRRNQKGVFKKLFYLKLLNFPQIKLFKIIKKFYSFFLIKKNIFFLAKLYNSYILFFLNNLNLNILKKQYLRQKYDATSLSWTFRQFLKKKKVKRKLKKVTILKFLKILKLRLKFLKKIKKRLKLLKKVI